MVRPLAVVASAFLLVACGGSNGPAILSGPASAQSVAANDSDFPGLKKCPQSGNYDAYLKAEQTAAPDQYQTDKSNWDQLKASGVNDSYVAVYAADTSDCGKFSSSSAPSGKVAQVYAFRFKDSASASASYKTDAKTFHLSDPELSQLKSLGATISQGTATGLGDNSISLSFDIQGESLYLAFWQNKQFEVAVITFNVSPAPTQAATSINGRIH